MTHGNPPSPERILLTLNAYQQTAALQAAIQLEVFTHIARGHRSAADIAHAAGTPERSMRILCDFLTIIGFLSKQEGNYGLAPDAALFLDRNSPAYFGDVANFVTHETVMTRYRDLAAVVRHGGSLDLGSTGPEHPIWVEFARSMTAMMGPTAETVAKHTARAGAAQKVLDIAAGHGLYGVAVARANPQAELYAVDWPDVLKVALENAAKAGVAARYHTLPGSAFDVNFGTGYDLVLLPNFLHHFDHTTNVMLLKKIHAALQPGATLATVEFVPNEDRVSPPMPAAFSLQMLGSTPAGDAYTLKELEAMFQEAGFGATVTHPALPSPGTLLLTARP